MKNFESVLNDMRRHGMKVPEGRPSFVLENARQILHDTLAYFVGQQNRQLEWLSEYDEVVDWLTDNKGRGLFLYGNCGRGKSLLTRYVLPAIFLCYHRKVVNVYDAQEMNVRLDEALGKKLVALDDIGTEEMINNYGNKRMAFAEIMDAAEKQNKLIFVSSNLQQRSLTEYYGDRVLERLKSTTRRILFQGASLRR